MVKPPRSPQKVKKMHIFENIITLQDFYNTEAWVTLLGPEMNIFGNNCSGV